MITEENNNIDSTSESIPQHIETIEERIIRQRREIDEFVVEMRNRRLKNIPLADLKKYYKDRGDI